MTVKTLDALCPVNSRNRCVRSERGQLAIVTGIHLVDWLVFDLSSIIIPSHDSVCRNGRSETETFAMKIIAFCTWPKSEVFFRLYQSIFRKLFAFIFHRNEHDTRNTTNQTNLMVDHNQERSTKQLKERTHDVYKWKSTLERAIKAQMDEISSLAEQRDRLMVALSVLKLPESIGESVLVSFGIRWVRNLYFSHGMHRASLSSSRQRTHSRCTRWRAHRRNRPHFGDTKRPE